MARRKGEAGAKRRGQVVEAAVAIIAEKGLHQLSLSAIEKRARMSRGQLTYYFPAKEDILVAVFDHMIETMRNREKAGDGPGGCSSLDEPGWVRLKAFLTYFLLDPPEMAEFHELQYTFLSQVRHRQDYRERLAGLYEEWRGHIASDLHHEAPKGGASARTLSTFIQALLHGLAIQRVADPESYDREEMLQATLAMLTSYLGHGSRNGKAPHRPRARRTHRAETTK
jgi:AcrR family transcriptional regulator